MGPAPFEWLITNWRWMFSSCHILIYFQWIRCCLSRTLNYLKSCWFQKRVTKQVLVRSTTLDLSLSSEILYSGRWYKNLHLYSKQSAEIMLPATTDAMKSIPQANLTMLDITRLDIFIKTISAKSWRIKYETIGHETVFRIRWAVRFWFKIWLFTTKVKFR